MAFVMSTKGAFLLCPDTLVTQWNVKQRSSLGWIKEENVTLVMLISESNLIQLDLYNISDN